MRKAEKRGTSKRKGREGQPGDMLDVVSEMVSLHDHEFTILRANAAVGDAFGVDAADLIGKKCYEVFHGTPQPPDRCPHKQAIKSGAPTKEVIYEPKLQKYLLVSVTPIEDGGPGVMQTFHIARDVTEMKEAENSLRKAQDSLEETIRERTEILNRTNLSLKAEIQERKKIGNELRRKDEILVEAQELAHVGSYEWDMRTNELRGSEESGRIYGVSQPTGSFENMLKMIIPSYRENLLDAIKAAIDSPTGQGEAEYAIIRESDGQKRHILTRGKVTKDPRTNEPIYMRGVLWDITARREAEAELRAAGEALFESQNELRRLAAKLILKEQGESRRLAVELRSDFEQRLEAIISDIRKIRGPETDGKGPKAGPFQRLERNLQRILSDTKRISRTLYPFEIEQKGFVKAMQKRCGLHGSAHSPHITFESEGELEPPPYISVSLYRVLEEGLLNITRHARAKSAKVVLHCAEDRISLTIQDDGRGFDTATVKKTGHGLGLTAVSERIRLMKGTLRVESQLRQGTTLRIEVPLTDHGDGTAVPAVSAPSLTERQIDVIRLLAEGYVAKEIAAKLGVSTKAVEFHKYRVMKILGIKTTAELVRFTVKTGLV